MFLRAANWNVSLENILTAMLTLSGVITFYSTTKPVLSSEAIMPALPRINH